MRKLLATFALVLWASTAGAQPANHWEDLHRLYDEQPAEKTLDGALAFLVRAVIRLNHLYPQEHAGLLVKTAGENIVPYQGTLVSASRLCYPSPVDRPTFIPLIKVLGDVPTTNSPEWLIDDAMRGGYIGGCLAVGDEPPPVVTPPPVVAPPSVDWSVVVAQLKALAENQAFLAENVKQTVRNEVAAERAADAGEHQAIRDDVQSVWKNIGVGVLDLLKQPWVWTALAGVLAGWKMKGL